MKQATESASRLWRIAQALAVVATLLLVAGLVVRPEISLRVLWSLLIPLVPASLLISPVLWRNVCPLATLNLVADRVGFRKLSRRMLPTAGLTGIVLLIVLVPARRFVFNTDGVLLAATIAVVALAALGLGFVFDAKAGFCNSVCPVLPVERLYGQAPMVTLGNPRCIPCTGCTVSGCVDLSPQHSIPATLGAARRSARWLLTSYGVFAAAFPGFIVGYFTQDDVALSAAGAVYQHVVMWALASYVATAVLARVTGVRAGTAMVALAAASAGLYYWFAAASISTAWGLPTPSTELLRAVTLGLIALWTRQALRRGVGAARVSPAGF